MRVLKYRKTRGVRNRKRHAINAEREKVHVAKGDTVRVVRGDDKGKEGKVIRVYPKTGRITIEGVNIVKKHRKARKAEEQSGIIEMPAPMHASNVMLLDPKSGEPTRIRARIDTDGTKERISVKSGDALPRPGKSCSAAAGTPARCSTRTASCAIRGVCSAGFASTGLPAASAAATSPTKIASGKFHGEIATIGPSGTMPGASSSTRACAA